MSALDSLTMTSIPPEDEALRTPVQAFLRDAMQKVPAHIRAKSWAGYDFAVKILSEKLGEQMGKSTGLDILMRKKLVGLGYER